MISLNFFTKSLYTPVFFLVVLVLLLLPISATQLCAQKKVEVEKKEGKVRREEKRKPLPVIKVSKETTYFTEPLLKNGRVDYLTAINEHQKPKGLIPEKNGAIYLVKAIGSHEGGKEHFAKLLKALGVNKDGKGLLALPKNQDSVLIRFHQYIDLRTASLSEEKKQKLKTQLKFCERECKPWKKEDYPERWKWIQKNEQPLKMIAKGTEQPFFYLPYARSKENEEKALISVLSPIAQMSRAFARLLIMRAMNHLGENRPQEAAKDLMTMHKLARQIGHRGTLTEGLVGVTVEYFALFGDVYLAQHTTFSAKQLNEYTKKVQSLSSVSDLKESLNLVERCLSLDLIQHVAFSEYQKMTKSIPGADLIISQYMWNSLFDWNLILKRFNTYFDELEKINQKPFIERRKLLEEKEKELERMRTKPSLTEIVTRWTFFSTKYRSRIITNKFIYLLLDLVDEIVAEEVMLMNQDLSTIHFQLEIYKRNHGKYPASLKALVPNYLTKIPKERFVAKQDLKYQSDGKSFKLYSVGSDCVDNKGLKLGQSSEGWDEVIEVK